MEAASGDGGGGGEAEPVAFSPSEIEYVSYGGEHHLPQIMGLVDQELSEPYSIFTYRYFVYLWPNLSFLAFHRGRCVGTVVCKMGEHRNTFRGYIAMLVVIKPYRGRGIATELVTRSIRVMMESGCEEEFVPDKILKEWRMPEEWRKSVVVPFYKNKGDIQSCKNYRGIKLMSHTMKFWERVIENRMRCMTIVSENQFGFMPSRSTTEAIFLLRQLMEKY